MGFNREDFVRIRAEYSEKYLKARKEADMRRWELYEKIPDVGKIDAALAQTGSEIMSVIASGANDLPTRLEEIKRKNNELLKQRASLLVLAGYPEDYSDIRYECEKCGDTGYVDTKMCDCMRRALIMAGYESSGLAGLIKSQSFDNFSLDYYRENPQNYEMMKKLVSNLKAFAKEFNKDTYKNYLFIGKTGLGKTHISTAVAKTVIEGGHDVAYVTALGMVDDFEAKHFGKGDKAESISKVGRYYSADLLIIDDFGTELTNQFTVSCMYDVINSRINNRKCTIINTNLRYPEIEAKYGERIASRMLGEYLPIVFSGTDIRRQKLSK